MIIYQGKALRDGTTLEENKVAENSFLVVVLCKSKSLPRESSVADTDVPTPKGRSLLVKTPVAAAARPMSKALAIPDSPSVEASTPPLTTVTNASVPASTSTPVSVPINISVPASTSTPVAVPINTSSVSGSDVDCQVASNLVTGNGLENTIQHILDMGGGIWDRDTVVHALRAASNDPERAVEFLYTGIPEQAEAGKPTNASAVSQLPTPATVPSSGPNAGPLNIFPQGFSNLGSDAGPLDFLRHSEQFQVLRAMVQANPQTLQPMLQELGKQNPNLMRLIQERQMDFQRLLYEPVQGEGNILEQFAGVVPQAVQVTPQEHASIERLEAMGFDRSTVLEAYFACNKNEELTANYLLDHMHEF